MNWLAFYWPARQTSALQPADRPPAPKAEPANKTDGRTDALRARVNSSICLFLANSIDLRLADERPEDELGKLIRQYTCGPEDVRARASNSCSLEPTTGGSL